METHTLEKYKTTEALAIWYDRKYIKMGKGWDCPRSEALKYLAFMGITNQETGKSLLDIGCGQGHFTAIANEFVESYGIDISQVVITMAQNTYPDMLFNVGDIETLQASMLMYDYVTSIGSLEHCVHIPIAISRIHSILKPQGIFYVLAPNELWQHFDQPNEVTHTDEEWLALFPAKYWKLLKQERIGDISHFLFQKEAA